MIPIRVRLRRSSRQSRPKEELSVFTANFTGYHTFTRDSLQELRLFRCLAPSKKISDASTMKRSYSTVARRSTRTRPASFVCKGASCLSHTSFAYAAPRTTVDADYVTWCRNNCRSRATEGRLIRYCCALLLVLLFSTVLPVLPDFVPPEARTIAATMSGLSATNATSTEYGNSSRGPLTKTAPNLFHAEQPKSRLWPAASQAMETGPFRAAEKSHQRSETRSLPILLRQPYIADNPELARFPLSVNADLTEASFEAIEKASLEIARAVRQQQRPQRSERREQDLHGKLHAPAPLKGIRLDMRKSKSEEELVGENKVAAHGGAHDNDHAAQHKITESSISAFPPPRSEGEKLVQIDDDVVEDEAEKLHSTSGEGPAFPPPGGEWERFPWIDDDDGNGEDEVQSTDEAEVAEGGGGGGRLIVGLTEITFPDLGRNSHLTPQPSSFGAAEKPDDSSSAASPLREQASPSSRSRGKEAGNSGDMQPKNTSENATEKESEAGPTLSHKEAVQKANQRLRLDLLQKLGILKSVKVLENVGLLILELRENLSETEIKDTVKSLWQRNKSTWLIEPDSEVVFRGRDAFDRNELVPVMLAKKSDSAEEGSEATASENSRQTNVFLSKEEQQSIKRDQHGEVQQKIVHQYETQATNNGHSRQPTTDPPKGKRVTGLHFMRLLPSNDYAQTRVSRRTGQKQPHYLTVPEKMEKRFTREGVSEAEDDEKTAERGAGGSGSSLLKSKEEMHDQKRAQAGAFSKTAQRRLTVAKLVAAAPSASKCYNASPSEESMHAVDTLSKGGSDEPQRQMQHGAVNAGTTENSSFAVSAAPDFDQGAPHGAFSTPNVGASIAGGVLGGEKAANVEKTISSSFYKPPPPPLLKPKTGIISISMYDAAQEAVRDALEENAVTLETGVSRSAPCHECLKALSSCERWCAIVHPELAEDAVPTGITREYINSATSNYAKTAKREEDRYKPSYTRGGFSRKSTQVLNERTRSGRQRALPAGKTELTEARPADQLPAVPSGKGAATIACATAQGHVEADERPKATVAGPGRDNQSVVTLEDDVNAEQPEDSAQRRMAFASAVTPVGDKHLPNDQYFSRQWAYHGPGVNVRAVEAWNLLYKHRLSSQRRSESVNGRAQKANPKKSSSAEGANPAEPVIVAVIDTGVDYNHEDLRTQMWVNEGEIPANGIDDDGNGYVDDYHGYDFENDKDDPMDYNGHGTHVAGILAAAANNKRGITGVNWEVKVMPLKFIARSAAAAEAIDYSLRMGAKISTNSWGYASPSEGLRVAVQKTAAKGQLFVSAVDNAGKDNTYTPDFPPNWGYNKRTNEGARNILRVANLTPTGSVSGTSNFGPDNVDVVAPGTDIISTVPVKRFPERYGYKTGTSMATPLVADRKSATGSYRLHLCPVYDAKCIYKGIAAMVWSANPTLTAEQVRECIIKTSTRLRSLKNFILAGNVDAYAAVLDALGMKVSSLEIENSRLSSPVLAAPAFPVFMFPAAFAAPSPEGRLYYASPAALAVENKNVFPSEAAFFQHIVQSQPSYPPPDVTAELAVNTLNPSASPKNEDKPMTAAHQELPSGTSSFVANLASVLGPLSHLLFMK